MVRVANERTRGFYLGCFVWILLAGWLTVLDLGVIAFVVSVLLAIWVFGFRDKFSSETTASAYSVFNPGGKAILGDGGKQLDRQLRGGGFATTTDDEDDDSREAAPLLKTTTAPRQSIGSDEKLRRRSAAAAAAERRLMEQQQQKQMATHTPE